MLITTVLVLLGSLVQNTQAAVQPSVYLYVGPAADYIERQYADLDHSQAAYLYIAGEPVRFRVTLQNRGGAAVSLRSRGSEVTDLLGLQLFRKSDAGWDSVGSSVVQDAPAQTESKSSSLQTILSDRLELSVGSLLNIPTSLRFAFETGFYELRIGDVAANCVPQCRFVKQTIFRFEVRRPESVREKLELRARFAIRSLHADDLEQATGHVNAMLALHPMSVVAHQLSGDLAGKTKNRRRAETQYRHALTLLRAGQDHLLLAFRNPEGLRGLAAFLEFKLREATVR